MSFHVKRTVTTSQRDELAQYGGLRTTRWVVPPPAGKSVLEIQTTHDPRAIQKIPASKNYLTPGAHWHWRQDEYFTVKKGRYIFTVEGKNITVSAEDPQPIRVPARARHTFRVDETHEGPCVIEITTDISTTNPDDDPQAHGMNERFFRNIYSYLDDCYNQGVTPSIPQIMLMSNAAECSAALPGPGWLMRPLSYVLEIVMGRWYGGYIMGYKASYPEYWDDSAETKKST